MLSHFSHLCLFATLWTVALQDPLSMGFSRKEHWSGKSGLSDNLLGWGREGRSRDVQVGGGMDKSMADSC